MYEGGSADGSSLGFKSIQDFHLQHVGNYNSQPGATVQQFRIVLNTSDDYPESLNRTFTLDSQEAVGLSKFVGSLISMSSETVSTSLFDGSSKSSDFSIGDAILENPSVEYVSENLALSMTNAIRNMSGNEQALGTAYAPVTHIKIRWSWLVYPVAITLLGAILVVATIIDSHHARVVLWRTFPLAFLFHPLEGWDHADVKTTGRDEMEKIAKNMSGQLIPGKDGVLKLMKS